MMWILLVLGCARSGDTSPVEIVTEAPTEIASEAREVPEAPPSAVLDPETPDEDVEPCMSSCMKQNQARATAIEIIEADCRASCDGTQQPLSVQPLEPVLSPTENP